MNIIIVGYGKVGQALVRQLGGEKNNITVIDLDNSKLHELSNVSDVMTVCGNGATHSVQQEAGIERADLLIAVTGSDELNLLCCLIAKKAGDCQTIARVRSPQYSGELQFLKEELGLAMVINPEFAAAAEIARVLQFPSALKIDTFARGRVELIKFRLPERSPLVGCKVKDIVNKLHCDVLVCIIERGDEVTIAYGDFEFQERDIISIIAGTEKAQDFFRKIHYVTNAVKNVMIAGGGQIAYYLTRMLCRSGADVMIIDKDIRRCNELAEMLDPSVSVINGDASDQSVLLESGIESVGAFVALTNLDEENILLSLFARRVSNAKLVTKINRIDFSTVIKHLDLDSIIYPKNITAETIARYVRAMTNTIGCNVETLYNIVEGKVEAAEFIIREKSAVVGIPLSQLNLKKGVLVSAILRDRRVIIPRGYDVIKMGDSVVIVSNHLALKDITDILK